MREPPKVKDLQPPMDRMRSGSSPTSIPSHAGKSETTSERPLREYATEVCERTGVRVGLEEPDENEVVADIKAERSDIHGIYEVKPGDTLSKIAKHFLGDANRYQAIFGLNTDQLKDPNMIRVGQKLKIPNR